MSRSFTAIILSLTVLCQSQFISKHNNSHLNSESLLVTEPGAPSIHSVSGCILVTAKHLSAVKLKWNCWIHMVTTL